MVKRATGVVNFVNQSLDAAAVNRKVDAMLRRNPMSKKPARRTLGAKRVTLIARNPVGFFESGKASGIPYSVEVNQSGHWQAIAWFKDKTKAVEYANAFHDRYEKVAVRVMHSTRRKAKK